MLASVFHGAGDIRIDQVPDPKIEAPTDAIVRITRTAICGSDLWFYRGQQDYAPGSRTGHEPMGVVEEVGAEVRHVRPGDLVLAPFAISDGSCEFCQHGIQTSCSHGGFWAGITDGAQGQYVRAPLADGTLVRVPEHVHENDRLLDALFPLTDVMGTGHHAAVCAGVVPGSTAVVIGDGAVGLCGVLAARRLGAERIIAVGHHADRLEKARAFGATDIVSSRGDAAIGEIQALTRGGARHVLECVGAHSSMATAIRVARPGGTIGYVGVPHGVAEEGLDIMGLFFGNLTLRGGPAPVRAYMRELMDDVLEGTLDPSPVFDMRVDIEGIPDGYAAMNERKALKVLVQPR
ncbi:zinc-dependent alcohol dehydrogenase family protein [Pseudenhygromyxa sp. WMMC2535]|uniref:zinc-dependent alcohol dehydrogenase family protein n=1 Tax=Pseudenhygromyxa sp. WMMC2535 TaxID=2712867 RepID=UPI0015566188|nr:zinc-dependent alcohol dehydrogenase family protein [Pseudenhygromyxa sp. WMMC2535]NVB37703.1 zinc-dependent alcohol dehydrogenase family protein [Pseudenhygromyxa sp. WMMC2535]